MYTRAKTRVYTCSAPIWIKTCTSVHIPHISKYTSVRGNMFNTMCIYIYVYVCVCAHIYIYNSNNNHKRNQGFGFPLIMSFRP